MSLRKIAPVQCDRCETAFESEVWTSLNATLDPHLKQALFENSLNRIVCPGCHENTLLGELLYHDQEKKFMIWYKAPGPDGRPDFEPGALDIADLLPDYLLRIVLTRNNLIEKILTFEAGVDDRLIEIVKFAASCDESNPAYGVADGLCFVSVAGPLGDEKAGPDNLVLEFLDPESEEPVSLALNGNEYAAIESRFAGLFSSTGGRGDGWCVIDREFVVRAVEGG